MKIQVNGQTRDIPGQHGASIAAVIAQFGKDPSKIIAELNGTIVPSPQWPSTALKEGDTLELVAFVGGG